MANFTYTHAKHLLLTGALNLATADMRVCLVMTNTTADTEKDVSTFAGFTTLDEYDGANYTTPGAALTGEAVTQDDANDRSEFDANDATFTALGVGTRQCQGAIVYAFVSNLNASIPIAWIDTGGFPFTGNGSNVTIQWNAEGIVQAT